MNATGQTDNMNILLVEDDISHLEKVEKYLKQRGHHVLTAGNAEKALSIMAETSTDMVMAKRILPEINGIELCKKIRATKSEHHIHLLLMVAANGLQNINQIIDCGVDDVITWPVEMDALVFKLQSADRSIALERELNQKFLAIRRNYYQSIDVLAQLIDAYDNQVGDHCRRVGKLSLSLAKRHPQVAMQDYPIIEACGRLHDIGLIGLPRPLLNKRRTELRGEETTLYRSHSERGEKILGGMDLMRPIARLVRMHHEQHNGRGFPDGLSGDRLPIGAAIVSAASIYDDLVHLEKVALEDIAGHLQPFRGYQLAPDLVDLLLEANLANIQEEAKKTDRMVLIANLDKGMVLNQDLIMKSGAFLMAAGTVLDETMIEKLKRYHLSGNIFDKVSIRK